MQTTHESYWQKSSIKPRYPALTGDAEFDVVILGGGITGLTAALGLKRAGMRVALIEQHTIGSADTGFTTAHLTEMVDARYDSLINNFGVLEATKVAEASRAAIAHIEKNIELLNIDCDFKRVDAFLYGERDSQVSFLRKELGAAQRVGIDAAWVDETPLPFPTKGGIRISNQAEFHPLKYLNALAAAVNSDGSRIFENTHAVSFEDGHPCRVKTENGTLISRHLIVATNSVSGSKGILQTKIAAYRTYAIGVRLNKELPPEALYWDAADPYHYTRRAKDLLIIGGEDHKTGLKVDTEECYRNLFQYAQQRFDVATLEFQWSGQVLEPVDGLPYIGLQPGSSQTFISVGYSGNGMTFGTVGGMMLTDAILGIDNAYKKLFEPSRTKPVASAIEYISENKDFPICFIKDRISTPTVKSFSEIGPNQGKVVRHQGEVLGVFREASGKLCAVNGVCPHMGCFVRFNDAEKTWDCPCHGSRFATDGQVINGPALHALKQVELPADGLSGVSSEARAADPTTDTPAI